MRVLLRSQVMISFALLAGSFLAAGGAGAQTPDDPAAEFGFKPYGSFTAGDIDSINLLNLNLNVRIPLVSYPQRGGKRLFCRPASPQPGRMVRFRRFKRITRSTLATARLMETS